MTRQNQPDTESKSKKIEKSKKPGVTYYSGGKAEKLSHSDWKKKKEELKNQKKD